MLGFLLCPYYVYTSDRDTKKAKRRYEEEWRRSLAEAQSRTNAEAAMKERIREEWNTAHTVDEKYGFVMKFTEPGRYPPNVVPIPEMAKWWEEVGHSVVSWRHHLARNSQLIESLKQLGTDAYDYGPHRKELRGIWAGKRPPVEEMLTYLARQIEVASRCLAGENEREVVNDIEWRKAREARAAKRAIDSPIDEDTETLARRLAKLPRVRSMQARIEKPPDGKSVLLFLNLSQEERAVAAQHGLDEIVYDDEPAHAKEELDAIQAGYDDEIADMQGDDDDSGYDEDEDPSDARERREQIGERKREIAAEMRALKPALPR